MGSEKIIVAIDGHSSCGKSTMAKALARRVGYTYIDTGAMYRAVALYALRHGLIAPDGVIDASALAAAIPDLSITFVHNDEAAPPHTLLCGRDVEDEIRTMEVSSHVSPIAALPCVRLALTRLQQAMGQEKGIVMDGRDIGTAVFPEAELKVFVTASDEMRAQRRFLELQAKGQETDFNEVLRNVRERDYIDSHRALNPLRKAPDAVVLDNSFLTREEQLDRLLALFAERTGQLRRHAVSD